MEQSRIDRLNELARRAGTTGLSEAETVERAGLRQEYIQAVLGSLENQLEHTYVVDKQGHKKKLEKRED